MSITIRAFANADQAFVLWQPNAPAPQWVGFALERQDMATHLVVPIANRIPASAAEAAQGAAAAPPPEGLSSRLSPIRRMAWMDFGLNGGETIRYRAIPMVAAASGGFTLLPNEASPWSAPVTATGDGEDGLVAYFNRGQMMSQIVSRLVDGDVSPQRLKALVKTLDEPASPARRYLSGQARHALLDFMAAADKRGSQIYAALYEVNDLELIAALKTFRGRGHVLLGNGGATPAGLKAELAGAGLDVHHRDLSKAGKSSPSVHNKFVVEVDPQAGPVRVLTGSTNWTVTGLCTQLNNVLILPRPEIAKRFRDQWDRLVAAGDDMPADLKAHNVKATVDRRVSVTFAASQDRADLAEVAKLIAGAKQGCLFLMFKPGQSPLLKALLDRSKEEHGPYVRGIVSEVDETASGEISAHNVTVISTGQVGEFKEDILEPQGQAQPPAWAKAEFDRKAMFAAGLKAIVHSKTIVIDPFSDECVVITGSHNFSAAASDRNDENLVIVRGDKALAERYAVHIQGVYDAFAWRAFLSDGGASDVIYKGLDGWTTGRNALELAFWLGMLGTAHPSDAHIVSSPGQGTPPANAPLSGDPDFGGGSAGGV